MVSKYSGKDFLEQLRGGSLKPSLFLFGIAKLDTEGGEYILFSRSTGCGEWISIPLDMVESVEVLGWSYCKDHTHPRVRLQLLEPATDNLHAQVFGQLLRAQPREVIGDATIADESQAYDVMLTEAPAMFSRRASAPSSGRRYGNCRQECWGLTGAALGRCLRDCRDGVWD
jgi:hypothetical protein